MTQILYTPELANRALPLVRRIVEDLVRDYQSWRERVQVYERAAAAPDADAKHVDAQQRDVQRLAAEIQGYLGELAALGVECKGLDVGLVDFPGEMDGAPACLCWKLGEPTVAWWHRPDAGFAGRRPLPGVALTAEVTR